MPTFIDELSPDAELDVASVPGERDRECADYDCGRQAALMVMMAVHGVLATRPRGCLIGGKWLPLCLLCYDDVEDGYRLCARCACYGIDHQLRVINTRPLR